MITRVIVRNFRGVRETLDLQLARLTLLSGRNGLGKTTLFDAIDWCLFGSAWRLGAESGTEANLYAVGEPLVELCLTLDGVSHTVARTPAGPSLDGARVTDRDLVTYLVTDADVFPPYARDLQDRVRRFVYMPQADVRGLLSPDSRSERTALLQALLGVPHAAVIESSVRRMRDHLEERCRELERKAATLSYDLSILEQQMTAVTTLSPRDMAPILESAEAVLGDSARQLSTEGLLQSCRVELETVRRRMEQLRELGDLLSSTRSRTAALSSLLADRRNDLIVYQESAERAAATSRRTQQIVESRRSALGQDDQALADLTRRRDLLQEAIDASAGLAALDSELDRAKSAYILHQAALERAQEVVNTARRVYDVAKRQLEEAMTRLTAVARRLDLAKEKQSLSQELVATTEETRLLEQRLAAEQLRVAGLQEAADEAVSRLSVVETAYRQSSAHADLEERFRQVLAQVVATMENNVPTGGRCPLCGSHFRDDNIIRSTIREWQAQQRGAHTELEEARAKAARARELAETAKSAVLIANADLNSVQRELECARQKKRDVTVRLRSIREALSVERLETERQELARIVEARSLEETTSERELKAAETDAARATHDFNRTKDSAAISEVRRGGISERIRVVVGALSSDDRNFVESMKTVSAKIADLHARRAERERDLAEALRESEQTSRNAESAATLFEEKKAGLAALSQEMAELQNRQKSKVLNVLGDGGGDALARVEELRSKSVQREAALLSISNELVRVLEAEQAQLLADKIAALDTAQADTESERDRVGRAKSRFGELAAAVMARAEREANDAMQRHSDAIQHCMAVLYPHRHLDRVVIHASEGSILLQDDLLGEAVRPDLYASTGQANVLALSVFLGIAMQQRATNLGCVLLDEPVQNLDDLRFLAFLTLLKRFAMSKQVVLSSADSRVVSLIRLQSESSWAISDEDFAEYEWVGFDPTSGPIVRSVPLRRSAAA